jgi:hypothetical protein
MVSYAEFRLECIPYLIRRVSKPVLYQFILLVVESMCARVSSFQACVLIRYHLRAQVLIAPGDWAKVRSTPLDTGMYLVSAYR